MKLDAVSKAAKMHIDEFDEQFKHDTEMRERYGLPDTGLNDIGVWLPPLVRAGVPTPKTAFVTYTAWDMSCLLDGKTPSRWSEFEGELNVSAEMMPGLDVFLRHSVFSGKHEWKDTCFVEKDNPNWMHHVASIVNLGSIVNVGAAYPWHRWVVREYLPAAPQHTAFSSDWFGGMPVRQEFRAFVSGNHVEAIYPYWPPDAFEGLGEPSMDDLDRLSKINEIPSSQLDRIYHMAAECGEAISEATGHGRWSVDLLRAPDGWYVTDCAVAEQSWNWGEQVGPEGNLLR